MGCGHITVAAPDCQQRGGFSEAVSRPKDTDFPNENKWLFAGVFSVHGFKKNARKGKG